MLTYEEYERYVAQGRIPPRGRAPQNRQERRHGVSQKASHVEDTTKTYGPQRGRKSRV